MIGFKNVTDQRRICFKEVMCFLKLQTSLHTSLAAETHPADEELLEVAAIKEEFLKLCGRPQIPLTSKREGKQFKTE